MPTAGRVSGISGERFFGALFVLACLNPWTSFGTNSMDSQPWPIMAGALFLMVLQQIQVPKGALIAGALIIVGLTASMILSNILDFGTLARAAVSYLSLIVVFVGFYNYILRWGFPKMLMFIGGASWIFFAFVEMVAPSITSMLSAQRTSAERGLTSLSPEPTFFAIFLIFFVWVVFVGHNYRVRGKDLLLLLGCVAAIFVLARSTMGALYVIIAMILWGAFLLASALARLRASRRSVAFILAMFVFAPLSVWAVSAFLEQSRLTHVFSTVMSGGGMSILQSDISIITRIESSALSIHGFFFNMGLPGGLDTFDESKLLTRPYWGNFFWYPSDGDKIMSWLGAILFELGIFGLLAYLALLWPAMKRGGASWAQVTILTVLLVGAIPVAFSFIPMLLATWAAQAKQHRASEVVAQKVRRPSIELALS